MKVGGNESATKYFQSHGGTAALASKDPKTKYTSNAATKYKDELKRRVAADAKEYPEEVVITDIVVSTPAEGTDTPPAEDDFFSSWDKPSIKRPSNPPSRTQTPPAINRTASPFLNPNANGNGLTRPKSPLANAEEAPQSAPTQARAISSSAIRKTATSGGPRKANVLGAKKTQKLGAKKIGGGEEIDFDAAEKKAKEEAERIAKLGYDPEAEEVAAAKPRTVSVSEKTKLAAPTPLSPTSAAAKTRERTSGEMERLGMGVGRLGFGQLASKKPAADAPKKMGFGSVGGAGKAAGEGMMNPKLPNHSYNARLNTFPSRRIPTIRPPEIRHPKGHLLGRILRPQQLQPVRGRRGQDAPPGLRGRHLHLLKRLLWTSGRRPAAGGRVRQLRRSGGRGEGFCAPVREYGGG